MASEISYLALLSHLDKLVQPVTHCVHKSGHSHGSGLASTLVNFNFQNDKLIAGNFHIAILERVNYFHVQ